MPCVAYFVYLGSKEGFGKDRFGSGTSRAFHVRVVFHEFNNHVCDDLGKRIVRAPSCLWEYGFLFSVRLSRNVFGGFLPNTPSTAVKHVDTHEAQQAVREGIVRSGGGFLDGPLLVLCPGLSQ